MKFIPNGSGKFRFWCQKVLPLVYDDSLSYYEVLCKLTNFVNELAERIANAFEEINLNIQEYVYDWLVEHPEATTTVLDHSLTRDKLVIGTLGFVTPEMYGAVGDGTTDDSTAFTSAINFAYANNIPLVCSEKNYVATGCTSTHICDIIGNNARINFGEHRFVYDTNVEISNCTFVSTFAIDKDAEFIYSFITFEDEHVDNIKLSNVKFICPRASNTLRGYNFFRVLATSCDIDGVEIRGAWSGIIFNNELGLTPNYYNVSNVIGYNAQTLIDFEGYVSSTDYSGYLENVTVENVALFNTPAQKLNYTAIEGADCVLITNVRNVKLVNISSDNAVERTVYAINITNGFIDKVFTEGSQSTKVVGTQLHQIDASLSGYIKSSNISISNIHVTRPVDGYAILLYEADYIDVNNIYFEDATGVSDYGIGITGVCTRINISHVRGYKCNRGLVWIYAVNGRDNDITFVKISDINFDLPVDTGTTYNAIRIEGINSVFARYICFEDVIFCDKYIKYSASSPCKGLISANYCQNLKLDNCEAKFINTLGTGINIDSTCSDVEINGRFESLANPCVVDFRCSKGIYEVYQEVNRNTYATVIQSNAQYKATPVVQKPIRQRCTMLLEYGSTQLITTPISDGYIRINARAGWLEGYISDGVFVQTHQGGIVGTSNTNVIFDVTNMSLTLNTAGTLAVSVDLTVTD